MNEENYVGHRSQLYGVEEHRLVGGKGDGMRLFQIKNGRGIDFTVSADRCADISRLSLHGVNVGYFGPCGYVAPQYYDGAGFGFLKSFTAGFLTTCGFTTIGSPSTDEGEDLPLHGNISHVPAEEIHYEIGADEILVRATMTDASLFGRKLTMTRTIACGLSSNKIRISDKIANRGSETSPLMLLYHVNIGYPLLDETSDLRIPSTEVIPRDARAKEGIGEWSRMLPPQHGFAEQCYYHRFGGKNGRAKIFNDRAGVGLSVNFETGNLPSLVQWKMMGEKEYVLGLEPCNSTIEGRKAARENGTLKFIAPGEEQTFGFEVELFDSRKLWEASN